MLLILACTPGSISFPTGDDQLRTAFFDTEDDSSYENVQRATVLLANSDLSCDSIPDLEEIVVDENILDSYRDLAAFTRENARVVILTLYQRADGEWTGDYPLIEDHSGDGVSTANGVAGAAYLGVEEAELYDEDGLQRNYFPGDNPGDCLFTSDVGEPGEVVIKGAGDDHLRGTFALESLDVSGRFRAERCDNNDFLDTFRSLALFELALAQCVVDDTTTPVTKP